MGRKSWIETVRREPFNIPYIILTMVGWWFLDTKSTWKKYLYNVYSSLSIGSFLLLFFNHILDFYLLVQEEKYKEIPASLYGSLLTFLVVTKALQCRFNWRTIAELRLNLANQLDVPGYGQSPEEAAVVKKSKDEMVAFISIMGGVTVPVLFFWIARPFFLSDQRTLPFTYRFFLDVLKSPVYECFIVYEMCSMVICCFNILSMDQLITGFIIQISAHYEVLTNKILKLGERNLNDGVIYEHRPYDETEREMLKQEIKKCVQHHQIILKHEGTVLEFLRRPLFFHFIGLSLMVCVIFLDIVDAKVITMKTVHSLIYAGSALFTTFIYCYYGTSLATKSENLAAAVYDSRWLEADLDTRRALILIKAKAAQAPQLNAILFPVDLPLFLSIIQLSYNMMAVLQSTVE